MKVKKLLCWTALAVIAVSTSSCRTATASYPAQGQRKTVGPPAHAPAHGYRRKLPSNVEVVFDAGSGVYVVVGWDKHFWLDGQYYRFRNGQWEVSVTIENGWTLIGEEKLPPGLCKQYSAAQQSKHPGRGLALGKKKIRE